MSNMSYCRFENTVADLADCLNNLHDEELNEREHKHRKRLVAICKKIVDEAEDLYD